ncbi:MAG TPA: ABC transporter ATP-binding protein [Pirellulales bacterium]|jgi:ABC-2 type transport system ATP-binding protein|nr:ABC transporter ATP-binding protein [Pirellulales bacterium]
MTPPIIVLNSVVKRFGDHEVLKGLSLEVQPGQTFAFLGRNGAGKTTTIRMLLGLLKPDGGSIRVLGLDPAKHEIEVRKRVGYLAEDQQMFGWMKIEEIVRFMAPFYPTWDHELANRYARQFELPPRAKIKHLSKGQVVRLGLLLALAHRPELVILDDPALGLDPIMRKEFNRDLITHLQGEGRTVFYSSHLLYEVEPVADMIAIIDHGALVKQAPTETLREQVKRIVLPRVAYDEFGPALNPLDVRTSGDEVVVAIDNAPAALRSLAASGCPHRVVELNLDEIFEAYVAGQRDNSGAEPTPAAAGSRE